MSTGTLLVLWDVDGTLISNGGVSKMAYAKGFQLLTGAPPSHPVVTDGQTDPAILRSLLVRHGLEVPDDLFTRVSDVMPAALDSLVPTLRERGHAMPGARDAIDALGRQTDVIQSLLTGNIAPNGVTKVATFGLDAGLDVEVGGYGSDDEVRAALVDVARAKTVRKYGIDVLPQHVVLIGDTPRDVEAGRLTGAYVIAVATGAFTTAQLTAEGADLVLPDLRDTGAVVASILGVRRRP